MNLTPKQELHLRHVKAANTAYREAKRDAMTRARILAAQEVADYQLAMDREVRLAMEAGVPNNQIYRSGLGTSNSNTFHESLARTASAQNGPLARRDADPLTGRYLYDETAGQLTVTLTGEAFDSAARELDWDAAQAIAEGLNSAVFDVSAGQLSPTATGLLLPNNADWLPEFGNRHPVIVWMSVPLHAAEALAWLEKKLA